MARGTPSPVDVKALYPKRLKEERNHRGLSQQGLADKMKAIGFPVGRATVAKIELGRRPLEVSELVAFAAALDIPPGSLLLPHGTANAALTETMTVELAKAVEWMYGLAPLDPANLRTYLLASHTFWASGYGHAGAAGSGTVEKVTGG